MNRFLFPAVAALAFCACSQEVLPEQPPENGNAHFSDAELKVLYQMRSKDNRVTPEEALVLANDVIGFLDGGSPSLKKSASGRRVAAMTALRSSPQQKSTLAKSANDPSPDLPDTLAYLFNFADSAGFAIISADTRIDAAILAYSGSGTIGDTVDNPGLALFLEGAEYYIENCIAEAERMKDSLMNDILAKIDAYGDADTIFANIPNPNAKIKIFDPVSNGCYEEVSSSSTTGAWVTNAKLGPLLPVEWHQGAPFNKLVPLDCSDNYYHYEGKASVGCVATAVGQIMTYWQYPPSIDGYLFHWDILKNHTANPNRYNGVGIYGLKSSYPQYTTFAADVSKLMERIGFHIGMTYGCGGSGAYPTNAVNWLKSIGYQGGELMDYNYNTLINSLSNGRPLLMRGKSIMITNKIDHTFLGIHIYYSYQTIFNGGHAWVVDGYLNKSQCVTTTIRRIICCPNSSGCKDKTIVTTYYNTARYLHNNWGWGGNEIRDAVAANGFFVADCFDARITNTNYLPSNIQSNKINTKSGQAFNFQYKIEMFPNIKH